MFAIAVLWQYFIELKDGDPHQQASIHLLCRRHESGRPNLIHPLSAPAREFYFLHFDIFDA